MRALREKRKKPSSVAGLIELSGYWREKTFNRVVYDVQWWAKRECRRTIFYNFVVSEETYGFATGLNGRCKRNRKTHTF